MMPGHVIRRLVLNEKVFKHLEELSLQAHLSLNDTIECVLYQEMVRSLSEKAKDHDT